MANCFPREYLEGREKPRLELTVFHHLTTALFSKDPGESRKDREKKPSRPECPADKTVRFTGPASGLTHKEPESLP